MVIQDEYVYYISGVNFTNLDILYTNAPELPRYFGLIYIASRVINAADSAVKILQIASLGLTAWAVAALIYRSINEKASWSSDANQFLLFLLLLLWPSNTYAVFVMPDMLYFNLFLIGFALSLSKIRSWQGQVVALGSTAGLLMHGKPHAAFLFPGLLAAIVGMKLMRGIALPLQDAVGVGLDYRCGECVDNLAAARLVTNLHARYDRIIFLCNLECCNCRTANLRLVA